MDNKTLSEMSKTESSDSENAHEGRDLRLEGRELSGTRGDFETADNEDSETTDSEVSGFTDSEGSEIVDCEYSKAVNIEDLEIGDCKGSAIAHSEDSEFADSEHSAIVGSENRDLADSGMRSGLLNMSGGVLRLSSKAGDSVCCSSWRSSNVTEEQVERPLREMSETTSNNGAESSSSNREFVGSSARLGLSDTSGDPSQLFSRTGDSVCCSSEKSSTLAKELVACALREMSETELSDREDSRESRDSISEGRRVSGMKGDFETANNEDLETVDSKYSKVVFTVGLLIIDGSGVKSGLSSAR